ncbi:hypothetical protein D3C83_91570 [compost metagenome]
MNRETFTVAVRKLAALLAANDGEALACLAEHADLLRSGWRSDYPAIRKAVEGFEFDTALSRLQAAAARAGIQL